MDPESLLLAPSPEHLAAVKVFPLIPALRQDIDVSIPVLFELGYASMSITINPENNRYVYGHGTFCLCSNISSRQRP